MNARRKASPAPPNLRIDSAFERRPITPPIEFFIGYSDLQVPHRHRSSTARYGPNVSEYYCISALRYLIEFMRLSAKGQISFRGLSQLESASRLQQRGGVPPAATGGLDTALVGALGRGLERSAFRQRIRQMQFQSGQALECCGAISGSTCNRQRPDLTLRLRAGPQLLAPALGSLQPRLGPLGYQGPFFLSERGV